MAKSDLNVERSLNQARWKISSFDESEIAQIVQKNNVPEVIARLLNIRGVENNKVAGFLEPKLSTDFPDPFSMAGMDKMAEYLAKAIIDNKKIAVFADFDVDGATSAALFIRFFRHLGIEVPFYIPDRLKEGYGPNEGALKALKEQGADIVLMCDCGITAFDVIESGQNMGLEICVFDHHEAEKTLPNAAHIINPKRRDDSSGLDVLAACGVVFMACVALNAKLRELGYFEKNKIEEVPLKSWLDIVALGTVCDMVPLTGVNRLFVRHGFKIMANTKNPGVRALCDVAGLNDAPNTYHAGFVLGPRINAGSRVHKSDLGASLLATDDPELARNIAFTLQDCNEKRKEIQDQMLEHAISMVEEKGLQNNSLIMVGDESWHPGLSGLVAGRLREKFDRPSVCITYAPGPENALEGRGSGRSVPGVNLGAAFIDARNEGILLKGGGHAMAAGFTVSPEKVDELETFLNKHIKDQLDGEMPVSESKVDSILSVNGARVELVRLIQDQLGPFGQGHEEPVFVFPNVRLHKVDIVGKDHVRAMVSDWEGGSSVKAIAFRAADTEMGQAFLKHATSQPFHLIGTLKIDNWGGRETVQIQIQDAAYALPQNKNEDVPKFA